MIPPTPGLAAPAAALALAGLIAGCGRDTAPTSLSPTVAVDSEAGRAARAQDERLRDERRRQEAELRRRHPALPRGD